MSPRLNDLVSQTAIALFLAACLVGAFWWLPQKWHACQKLYDNFVAQLVCFSESR